MAFIKLSDDKEKEENLLKKNKIEPNNSFISLEEEVETIQPPAEDDQEISQIHGAMAGIASGIIKVPEGIFSLGAELMDLTGITTDAAAQVEQVFDKINVFEETAEKTAERNQEAEESCQQGIKTAPKRNKSKRKGRTSSSKRYD